MARTPRLYLEEGSVRITEASFRSGTRTFALRHIEKTHLRRPGLVFGLAIGALACGSILANGDVLYLVEKVHLAWPPLLMIFVGARLGVLFIDSKALNRDFAAIGSWHRLCRVREALDRALDDRAVRLAGAARRRAEMDDDDAGDAES